MCEKQLQMPKRRCGCISKMTANGLDIAVFNYVEHHTIIEYSSNRIVHNISTLSFLFIIVGHFIHFNATNKIIRWWQSDLMQDAESRTQTLHGWLIFVEFLFSWQNTKTLTQPFLTWMGMTMWLSKMGCTTRTLSDYFRVSRRGVWGRRRKSTRYKMISESTWEQVGKSDWVSKWVTLNMKVS